MSLEVSSALVFGGALVLVFIVGRLTSMPFKWLGRLLINGVLGGVGLFLFNLVGRLVGFTIAINPLTALTAGVLGVPGVILLVVLRLVFAL